ncbi:MAG TPA: PaaI family thioesterase [Anaerolineales bacterium]|nr:PaaI family thioesterase [Anaerolineales bacterium]
MKRQIPYHGWCFVCGTDNPHSIGITMFVDEEGVLTSEFTLADRHQGPPGHAHGGASAAILDEVMGLVVWAAGHKVLAANININYRKPLPLHIPLLAEACITEVGERKISSVGKILLPDSTVAVEGSGVYVVAKHFFENSLLNGVHS